MAFMPGLGTLKSPTNRMVPTTVSVGLFTLLKRAFLNASELNSTRNMERMS